MFHSSRALEIQRHTDYRRMRWANGGGWTSEIAVWPTTTEWHWRLSVAEVDASGPFSTFPEVHRSMALLSGAGMGLSVGPDPEVLLDRLHRPIEFSGEAPTYCRLIDGPVTDLNLMVRHPTERCLYFLDIDRRSIVTDAELILVVSGLVVVGNHRLDILDSARVAGGNGSIDLTRAGNGPATVAVVGSSAEAGGVRASDMPSESSPR